MSVIEGHVVELGRVLRGPRRVRADLIREARDGLLDAAAAYEEGGLDPIDAQRRAVTDFGSVGAVAPDYQIELGYAQSQRTALLICLVLAPQGFLWGIASRAVVGTPQAEPSAGFALLDPLMSWLGTMCLIGAVLVAVACGLGVRYVGIRRRMSAVTGIFALTLAGVFGVSGTAMMVLGPAPLLSLGGLPWLAGVLVAPMALVAWSGRRCLAARAPLTPRPGVAPVR